MVVSTPVSNFEINQAYKRSFCVWNVYRRSIQSGALTKTFMFGTSVIASNIGSFPKFVENGHTGYLISDDEDYYLLLKKVLLLKNNTTFHTINCRNFLSTFTGKNTKG